MSSLAILYDSVNHLGGFDYRNTFKGLTFGDYISVIPASLRVGEKPYKGGYFFRCFNPNHPDTEPSLLVRPGESQTCIWKCFGSNSCPQEIFTTMFNTWLIKAGKLSEFLTLCNLKNSPRQPTTSTGYRRSQFLFNRVPVS